MRQTCYIHIKSRPNEMHIETGERVEDGVNSVSFESLDIPLSSYTTPVSTAFILVEMYFIGVYH